MVNINYKSRREKSRNLLTNNGIRGFTLVELAVVIAIFLLTAAFLAPIVRMTQERAARINCANNVRRLSLGIHLYASDHGGAFPAALGELYPKYVKDERVFDCPAANPHGTAGKPDYDYTAGLTESSPASEIIICDADSNHKGQGRNISRVDGSVEWVRTLSGKSS
jgi:prepilin-type N-terminal cleavage/methylation domain-containing protein